jgi:hypothetical protein
MSAAAPTLGRLVERLPMRRLGLAGSNERILAEASRLPRDAAGWTVARAGITSTCMAVVVLAGEDGAPGAVIKLPTTSEAAEGLGRESGVLADLGSDARLDGWRALVPDPCCFGDVLGQPYRVDRALPGDPPVDTLRDDDARVRMQRLAAEAIDGLHRATATRVVVDRRLAEKWIDARIESAFGRAWLSHSAAAQLDALRQELHAALEGRELSASWVHGDYWLGNVLFRAEQDAVGGIVDWDAAAPVDLPIHDILHLLLYGRRQRTGEELGQIVQSHLAGEEWSGEERELLDRYGVWSHDGVLSDRHVLLLYWLRHVGLHMSQGLFDGLRRRLWETRNVHRVLGAL